MLKTFHFPNQVDMPGAGDRLGLSSLWKETFDNVSSDPIIPMLKCQTSENGLGALYQNKYILLLIAEIAWEMLGFAGG
jgi:hypothetical protein